MAARPLLITIPISHFCEKARWALDRAGIDYDERPHVQVFHRVAAQRAAGSPTVPVLIAAERTLVQSADIVAWADPSLYPAEQTAEITAFEARLDEGLGPDGRLWMYFHMRDRRDLALRYNLAGVPRWEARAFHVAFPLLMRIVDRVLEVGPEAADRAEHAVRATFAEVGERLGDGRRYLMGDRFTAADLAFSALSAAVLAPPGYGIPLPQPDELPAPMAALVRELRASPAGAHALRMYREERRAGRRESSSSGEGGIRTLGGP